MRTENLFNEVDATISQTSTGYVIDCGQDMRWLLMIKSTGLVGVPKLYVEESINNVDWVALDNPKTLLNYFDLDDPLIHIRDSYFMGKSFRVRTDANGASSGTITAELVVKTKSN